ncbi:MAG: Fe-S cluster assembly protein SufB, partial [Candidatus Terrybacteria bacterium]|nr:Fe-S cluster assembly protein SufB [Candidatus Terrybacteria bacterium]
MSPSILSPILQNPDRVGEPPVLFDREATKGLTREVVETISRIKGEPAWMRDKRLQALAIFQKKALPAWGADLSGVDFDALTYYLQPATQTKQSWRDVPKDIKQTFDRLGIPQAERIFLAGVTAQYDSEVVYHRLKTQLERQGVVFLGMDAGLRAHPEIVRQYFGTIVPAGDNKFAALNTAVWSGGSFVYVPKGVTVEIPLQAYFRINADRFGQFERTLIVAEEGSSVHYVEGCTAPTYSAASLHAAVVEIIVKPHARVRYTTIQNWSPNVYNLVTKRMFVEEGGVGEWIDGNLGSRATMKYPSVFLRGPKARGEILSLALAGPGQHQDAGGKAIHLASETSSTIVSKSVSHGGGRTSYRGLVRVIRNARNARAHVQCDALILDSRSRSDTYP